MGFQFRKRIRFGPFALNLSRSGASLSAKAGPVSVNSRARRVRVNLPGPFAWTSKKIKLSSSVYNDVSREREDCEDTYDPD